MDNIRRVRYGTSLLLLVIAPSLFAAPRRHAVSPDRCTEIVTPAALQFPAAGGHASVSVTVKGGCPLSVVANDSWITAAPAAGGISVDVAPNTSTQSRTGSIHVRSSLVVVTQDATANLLQNGTFDTSIAGWSNEFATGMGSAVWAGGGIIVAPPPATPPGAAQITSTQAGRGYQLGQCVNVSGNTRYEAGAMALIPSGQPSTGVINFGIYEYWAPDCPFAQGYHGYQVQQPSTPVGTWFDNTIVWTSNINTKSVYVVLGAGGEPVPPFTAYFDNVYVKPK